MKKINAALMVIMLILFMSTSTQAQQHMLPPEGEKTIIDLNDEQYTNMTFDELMAQYKGKVVYLDFWASWCGPCKREMPFSSKLKESFKGKEVVFVYISTDRTAKPWLSAIETLKIGGLHYRVNKSVYQGLNAQFDVKYIPRYVLYDKEGKVVDANAKRPSNPELISDINALLQ